MAELTGGQFVGRILKEEGVEFVAGVHGGHIWPIMMAIQEQGIKFLHLRHEQTGPYIADGWARVTGRPGVCIGTAGPGMHNMVPGLAHNCCTRSPVVAFVGQHDSYRDDGWGGTRLFELSIKSRYRIARHKLRNLCIFASLHKHQT